MQRKLVKQGASTLMVSLPSKWVQANGLDKGSVVDIEETKRSLVVSPTGSRSHLSASVTVDGSATVIRRIILSLYEKGIDSIDIRFPHESISEVEKIVGQLIGYEIIRQEKGYCRIQDITGTYETDIDILLRRLFLLAKEMASESLDAIKAKDTETLKNIVYKDIEINKFTYLCRRLLNKNYVEESRKEVIYQTVSSIELIGDEYKSLIWHIIGNKAWPGKRELEFYAAVNNLLYECYSFVYKLDERSVSSVRKRYIGIREDLEKIKNVDFWTLHFLDNIKEHAIRIERANLHLLKNISLNSEEIRKGKGHMKL